MSRTATVEPIPRKSAPAAGLFGAIMLTRVPTPTQAANEPSAEEFVDDFIAGTHAHPLWENPAKPDHS